MQNPILRAPADLRFEEEKIDHSLALMRSHRGEVDQRELDDLYDSAHREALDVYRRFIARRLLERGRAKAREYGVNPDAARLTRNGDAVVLETPDDVKVGAEVVEAWELLDHDHAVRVADAVAADFINRNREEFANGAK